MIFKVIIFSETFSILKRLISIQQNKKMRGLNMDNGASSYHRFLKGDKSGLEELVEMYNDNLIFFLNGYVNNITVAEDLAAETFFEILVHKNYFKEIFSFKTWLFKVGRNNAIDYIRKQSRTHLTPIEDAKNELLDKCNLEEIILKDERKRRIHNALLMINADYQDAIYLVYFEDMSYDEAAAVLKKNSKQIKNLIYRAKQALKAVLEKEDFFDER